MTTCLRFPLQAFTSVRDKGTLLDRLVHILFGKFWDMAVVGLVALVVLEVHLVLVGLVALAVLEVQAVHLVLEVLVGLVVQLVLQEPLVVPEYQALLGVQVVLEVR